MGGRAVRVAMQCDGAGDVRATNGDAAANNGGAGSAWIADGRLMTEVAWQAPQVSLTTKPGADDLAKWPAK